MKKEEIMEIAIIAKVDFQDMGNEAYLGALDEVGQENASLLEEYLEILDEYSDEEVEAMFDNLEWAIDGLFEDGEISGRRISMPNTNTAGNFHR